MEVLVSATSVIMDLDRGDLLDQFFGLPYEFCVPDLLYRKELAGELGDRLQASVLNVVELTPEELTKATTLRRQFKALSAPAALAVPHPSPLAIYRQP